MKEDFTPFEPEENSGQPYEVEYEYDGQTIKVVPAEVFIIPEIEIEKILIMVQNIQHESIDIGCREAAKKTLPLFVKLAGQFLNKPYIIDNFGSDHSARRKWRTKLEEKKDDQEEEKSPFIEDIYKNNCLNINSFGNIASLLSSLIYSGVFISAAANEKSVAVAKNLAIKAYEYDKMNTAEKVEYIKKAKKQLFELLTLMSEI